MDVFVGTDPIDEGFSIHFEDIEVDPLCRKQAIEGQTVLKI